MRTQHGRARGNAKRTHQTSHFGIMGGLAPTRNVANSTLRAYREGHAKLFQDIPPGPVEGLRYMMGDNPMHKYLLSRNPASSGGVGRMIPNIRLCSAKTLADVYKVPPQSSSEVIENINIGGNNNGGDNNLGDNNLGDNNLGDNNLGDNERQPIQSNDALKSAVNQYFNGNQDIVNQHGDISGWDTGNVTDMSYLFKDKTFNEYIGGWDTSKVTDMSGMFASVNQFNQDLSGWNTQNVTSMNQMFNFANKFNQDISLWDTQNVKNMNGMFAAANLFNQNLSTWNTQNVTDMSFMFLDTSAFNQDLSGWCVQHIPSNGPEYFAYQSGLANQNLPQWGQCPQNNQITDIRDKVNQWLGINQSDVLSQYGHIRNWNTSLVTDMNQMFAYADQFNQDISGWKTQNVTSMTGMFYNAYQFNQNLTLWKTQNVTYMTNMFFNAQAFNGNLSLWDTSNVLDMSSMFDSAWNFNQDISSWKTQNVTSMNVMFENASQFNQNLSGWCVKNLTDVNTQYYNFAYQSGLSNQNFPIWGSCPPPSPPSY